MRNLLSLYAFASCALALVACGGTTGPRDIRFGGEDLAHAPDLAPGVDLAGPAVVPLEVFNESSFALDHGGPGISISDVSGAAGCALADYHANAPGVAHQIAVRIIAGSNFDPCTAGTYAISDCATDPGALDCAEYRQWSAGKLVGRAVANSGGVTVAYSGAWGGSCAVSIDLGFPSGETYHKDFSVYYSGTTTMCSKTPN